MRRFNAKVFDDIVSGTTLSSTRYDSMLGQFDDLIFQIILDDAAVTGGAMGIYLQHSADGRTWEYKQAPAVATANIIAGSTTLGIGMDVSGIPTLAFVRFFVSGPNTARVRVYVTGRDKGG